MTTLTFHLARARRKWGPADEIIVTELDHQANFAPGTPFEGARRDARCVHSTYQTGELEWDEQARRDVEDRLVARAA
jgi:selenocysteine lyase/cysteine desulfurase